MSPIYSGQGRYDSRSERRLGARAVCGFPLLTADVAERDVGDDYIYSNTVVVQ